jgi:hypothetical protein
MSACYPRSGEIGGSIIVRELGLRSNRSGIVCKGVWDGMNWCLRRDGVRRW